MKPKKTAMRNAFVVFAAAGVFLVTGCTSTSNKSERSKLVGKWVVVEQGGWPVSSGRTLTLEFTGDGRLLATESTEGGKPPIHLDGTYELTNGILIAKQGKGEFAFEASWIVDSISDTEAVLRQELWEGGDKPVVQKPTRLKRIGHH